MSDTKTSIKNFIYFALIIAGMIFLIRSQLAKQEVAIDPESLVIDVRTEREYNQGHLKNAINIPYDEIREEILDYVENKDEKIVLYCRSGRRSGIALRTLKELGYLNAVNAGAYAELKRKEGE